VVLLSSLLKIWGAIEFKEYILYMLSTTGD